MFPPALWAVLQLWKPWRHGRQQFLNALEVGVWLFHIVALIIGERILTGTITGIHARMFAPPRPATTMRTDQLR